MKEKRSPAYYLIIAVVCFFAFIADNTAFPYTDLESRTVALAEKVAVTGDLTAAGARPLPVWISAGVENIFPGSIAAQRAAAGAAATFNVIFLYLLVVRLSASRNTALIAALVLATSLEMVITGRTAAWLIYAQCFMLGAVYFMVRGISARCRGAGWMLLSGLFMGCSLLCGGLFAFIAILVPMIAGWAVVLRPTLHGKGPALLVLLLSAVVFSLWWYVYLYIRDPELLAGAVGSGHCGWLPEGVQSAGYFRRLPAVAGIWTAVWVTSIIYCFTGRRAGRYRRISVFSMVWFTLSLAALCLLRGKSMEYVGVLLIPGSITVSMYLWHISHGPTTRTDRVVFRINAVVIASALLAVVLLFFIPAMDTGSMPPARFITVTAIYIILILVIVRTVVRGGAKPGAKAVLGAVVIASITFQAFCLPALDEVLYGKDSYMRTLIDNPPKATVIFRDNT